MIAHPFVKWAGGKTSSLPQILARLPEKIGTYYEPFVGGGAVFFALAAEKRFKRAALNDINPELMGAYSAISRQPGVLIKALSKHVYEEDRYYKIRDQNPEKLNFIERAARFIYLNKTCFNGLYRVNRKGNFNVPFGSYANPTICDSDNIMAVNVVLKGATLTSSPFEEVLSTVKKSDAIYFDPPYVPASDTANFTAYSKSGFNELQQERLRDVAGKLITRGAYVLLSNSDTPLVRKLYRGFKLEEVEARRSINSKGGKRGAVGELLISGRRK